MPGRVTRLFEPALAAYGEGGHQGVDISGHAGEHVGAAASGTVVWVGELPRGRFVSVAHDGGYRTTYIGLGSIAVKLGDKVARGQTLGRLEGNRDPSSPGTHLHFGVYLNGLAVNPRDVAGAGADSFIRLCPVEAAAPSADAKSTVSPYGPPAGPERARAPFEPAVRDARTGFGVILGGLKDACLWAGGGVGGLWRRCLWPAVRACGSWISGAAKACWNNRWFKATIAGLAAAAVVVAAVIVAVITLPISITCAIVACVVGLVACLGVALYYAATHGQGGFSFLGCFTKSLSAGAAAAAAVVSMGSLSAAFSAGWAEMGLAGVTKAALANGVLSTVFEAGTSYLFTGRVSLVRLGVAFGIGIVTGPVTKALKEGVVGSRVVRALLVSASEGRVAVSVRTGLLFLKESKGVLHGMFILFKDGATAFGGKAAYVAFSGAFSATCDVCSCLLNHKPVTASNVLASLITGMLMGGIGLMFHGMGLEGLLAKYRLLETGVGRVFRGWSVKLITKSFNKGLSAGLESMFKNAFGETEAPVTKEE